MVYHITGGMVPGHWTENELYAIDGDFAKVKLIDESQDDGMWLDSLTFDSGRPVDGTHMPTRLRRGAMAAATPAGG